MRKEKSLSEISQTGNNNCPLSPDSQECFRFLEINTNKIISFMDDTCDDKYKSTNYTIQEEFIRSYPWRSYINIQKDPSRTTNIIGCSINKTNDNDMDKRSDQAYHDDGGSILLFHVL